MAADEGPLLLLEDPDYDKPIKDWTEVRFCVECDENNDFQVLIYNDGASAECTFCGWDDQLYAVESSLDDGGWG